MRKAIISLVTACLLAGGIAAGAEQTAQYELEAVNGIRSFVGSEASRQILARQGFVVTGQAFNQIFAAYIRCPLPKLSLIHI